MAIVSGNRHYNFYGILGEFAKCFKGNHLAIPGALKLTQLDPDLDHAAAIIIDCNRKLNPDRALSQ